MMRVVDHVAEHAKSQPERVAVTCRGDTTYAQLASRMDAIAHVLQQQDVKKGEYVGVMLERCAPCGSGTSVNRITVFSSSTGAGGGPRRARALEPRAI